MKKAVIIGASSGIGRELAKILSMEYDVIGLAARRTELLVTLAAELDKETHIMQMDVADTGQTQEGLNRLIADMGGVNLAVICAGTGYINPELKMDL